MNYSYGARARSIWYYLIFPIDAWHANVGDPGYDVFYQKKEHEILPIMLFLMPLIVLIAGFSLRLGLFSGLFFYGIESVLLAIVCKFYASLEYANYTIELIFNFWVSFIVQTIGFVLIFALFSIFF